MASEWKGSFHLLIAFLISTVSLVQSNTCIIEEFEVEPNFNETRVSQSMLVQDNSTLQRHDGMPCYIMMLRVTFDASFL